MNALAARIEKEARPLIWVWGALVVFGIIALAPVGSFALTLLRLRPVAFWIGISLLATLSLGHEFQHGTVSLLLTQPIDRMKVWREKWIVLLPAVATVAYVNVLDTTDSLFWPDWQTPLIAVVWIVIAVCTSTFWTLVGRSTINGFVLNILQGFGIFMAWQLAESFRTPGSESRPALPWLVVVAAVGYSFLMLWFGRRKLARFEVTGESSSTDLLTAGSRATHGHFAGLFRCLPTQPILNLIRKELRLLWLVWLLVLASILGVLCLAVFRFVPGVAMDKLIFTTESFIAALASLSAILTGSLSMGEERTLGTQSSNRMLPVSATVQWLIKLTVILFVPCLGLILPVAVAQAAFARDFISLFDAPLFLFAVPSLLSVAAFFCASVVKDTVRAALLVVPAIGVVFLASEAVHELMKAGILDAVILRFHPLPFPRESSMVLFQLRTGEVLIAITLPSMLIQSYRLFRLEIQESFRPVASSLLWVVLLASVFFTASRIPMAVEQRAQENLWRTVEEMRRATAQLPSDLVPLGEANSRQLTLEELSKVARLSKTAQILLRGGTISVKRDVHDIFPSGHSDYTTIIRFRNGRIFITDGYGIGMDFPGS